MIQLTSYSIRVTERNTHVFLPLDNFFAGSDLFALMGQTFTTLKQGLEHNDDSLTTFGISLFNITKQRHISGVIRSGDYGYESDLMNINSSQLVHHRQTNESDVRPFYFLVHMPQKATRGILLLERNGIYGVKTVFSDYFSSVFIRDYPDLMISFDILTPRNLIESVLKEGRFTDIEFIKEGIPNNFEDVIANDGKTNFTHGTFTQTISVPKGGFIANAADRIRDFLNDKRTIKNMYEIPDDFDNIKVRVEINGQYRTLDISKLDRYRPNYDISDEIEIGADGNPVFDSINTAAYKLLEMIENNVGDDDVR